jgi:hypothetical protein
MPPEDEETKYAVEKKCACRGTQKCIKCVNVGAAFKVDVIPYAQLMAEKKALCKFKHDASTTCHLCAPPIALSYTGDPKCKKGHRPWPLGICGSCAPPNAILKLQSFRHVDGISFQDVGAGNRFVSEWQASPEVQRCAILFGRVIFLFIAPNVLVH